MRFLPFRDLPLFSNGSFKGGTRPSLVNAVLLVGALTSGVTSRSSAQVQNPPCVSGCSGGGVAQAQSGGNGISVRTNPTVDPNRPTNSGPYTVVFWVANGNATPVYVDLTCSITGPLTCTQPNPLFATVPANDSVQATVTYSTTGLTGSGAVTLTAATDGLTPPASSGSRSVTVAPNGAGVVALVNPNVDNLDRGACLTVGAGESAGLSCFENR